MPSLGACSSAVPLCDTTWRGNQAVRAPLASWPGLVLSIGVSYTVTCCEAGGRVGHEFRAGIPTSPEALQEAGVARGVQVEVGPGKSPTKEVTLEAFELFSERHLPVP